MKTTVYRLQEVLNIPGNWVTRAYTRSKKIAEWWKTFPRPEHVLAREYYKADDQELVGQEIVTFVHQLICYQFFVILANTGEGVPTDDTEAEGGIRLDAKSILTWQELKTGIYLRILAKDEYGVYGRVADLRPDSQQGNALKLILTCGQNPLPYFSVHGNTLVTDITYDNQPVKILGMVDQLPQE